MNLSKKNNRKNTYLKVLRVFLMLALFLCISSVTRVYAADAAAISIGTIDYETLTMQVNRNKNKVVYYSTDKTTWYEVEGEVNADDAYIMDISWVSSTANTTLYFKGDTVKTYVSITLPKMNSSVKVSFDKAEGTLNFTNADEAETFQWRKSSDYEWRTVDVDDDKTPNGVTKYSDFLKEIDTFRTKGAKIIVRLPQQVGNGVNNTGARCSKEITVSITARAAAPNIIVNVKKLTLNTTDKMEYYNTSTGKWVECTKAMMVEKIAPKALYENGAKGVTVAIRMAATDTKPHSLTAYVEIPGQSAAPSIGDNNDDVLYYYQNGRLVLQFNKASAATAYEYAIVKSGVKYNSATATWKTVKNTSPIKLTASSAPEGATIHFRVQGTAESTAKNIALVLPSASVALNVSYEAK